MTKYEPTTWVDFIAHLRDNVCDDSSEQVFSVIRDIVVGDCDVAE